MKTDMQLKQDILDELRWEPSVYAAEIGVEVKDGVVTLAGEIGSYAEKVNAERAAQRVSGVKSLAIELNVKLSEFGKRTDADIARSAQTALGWSTSLVPGTVQVMVEGGWITLTGHTDWQYQKLAAAECVRHLSGVIGVSNQIFLEPIPMKSHVRADIESAIQRVAPDCAKSISVQTTGAVVTLSGEVPGWADRDLVTTTAWSTPGVRTVVDNLVLSG